MQHMTLTLGCPRPWNCVGGCVFNKYGETEGRIICILQASSLGKAAAASCWGGMSESGSLVPGGEVPSRQGKCRDGGERDAAKSRVEKHEHERMKEDIQPVDALQASFIFLVFGNVAALECGQICARHILGNRAEFMLTSPRMLPPNWMNISDRSLHDRACRDAKDQSEEGGGFQKLWFWNGGPRGCVEECGHLLILGLKGSGTNDCVN